MAMYNSNVNERQHSTLWHPMLWHQCVSGITQGDEIYWVPKVSFQTKVLLKRVKLLKVTRRLMSRPFLQVKSMLSSLSVFV